MNSVIKGWLRPVYSGLLLFLTPSVLLWMSLGAVTSVGLFMALSAKKLLAGDNVAPTFHPDIPRAWDDHEIGAFQVPLVQRDRSPQYLSAQEYYAQRVRTIYRTYPVYAPGNEPAGYMESLEQKEPEIAFDVSSLRTKEDWIRAGEAVFDTAPSPVEMPPVPISALLPPGVSVPTSSDGVIPYVSYVIRKKGVVELNLFSCAACHSRVMPDGSVVKGAQGNSPFEQLFAALAKSSAALPEADAQARNAEWLLAGTPWVMNREQFDKQFDFQELIRRHEAMQPGVVERHGTGSATPTKVPSLIGLQDIRYLDATGLMRHRSIGDMMRYVITNYGLDIIAHYGDFQPSKSQAGIGEDGTRFSDEQLYALALYIYSLQPPPNPNPFDDKARRGQALFKQLGCVGCHTPPLYTSNKLTPASGFIVPDDLRKTQDILEFSVETDASLATQTRRGTGFYKVPSLRGVWYRNALTHSGQVNSLEEWLDPARLREDYVPKGFHLHPGPIKGHEFGLGLSPDDKQALIAFLRTL
jgi:hypothetical protein